MKAFCLRDDTSTLKQAVTAHFDTPSLIDAYKHLWDFCGDLLKELGITYHTRHSTDKRDAFEATLILSQPPSKPSTTTSVSNTSSHFTSVDRSANVILFGVLELPLPMTKSLMKLLFTSLADLSQSRMPFELAVRNQILMSPLNLVLCLLNSITTGIEDSFLLLALLLSPLKNISCTFVKMRGP